MPVWKNRWILLTEYTRAILRGSMLIQQTFPTPYVEQRTWILQSLNSSTTMPQAWFFNKQWIEVAAPKMIQHNWIEFFERKLFQQSSLGLIRFTGSLGYEGEYAIIYLYDGTKFSHSIFKPTTHYERRTGVQSVLQSEWWIEPWQIDHLPS